MKHEWPADSEEHMYGKWMQKNRTTQYRVCVHPFCNAHEERPIPKA